MSHPFVGRARLGVAYFEQYRSVAIEAGLEQVVLNGLKWGQNLAAIESSGDFELGYLG